MRRPEVLVCSRQPFLRPRRGFLERVLREILAAHRRVGTLSVALVGDAGIRRVHREFLGDDTSTDVISFRYDDGDRPPPGRAGVPGPFGELIISAQTARREARRRGIDPHEELLRYAVHGLLHLLGHDDRTPAGRRRMRERERRYLLRYRPGSRRGSSPSAASRRRSPRS